MQKFCRFFYQYTEPRKISHHLVRKFLAKAFGSKVSQTFLSISVSKFQEKLKQKVFHGHFSNQTEPTGPFVWISQKY